jgi:Peptidase_C39 like family/Tetratricopeptide repeat
MMSEQHTGQKPIQEHYDDGVTPPSRLLLGLTVGLFLYFIAIAVAAFLIYRSQQRLIALIPLGIGAVGFLVVGAVVGAIIFRKALPRRLWLWMLIGLFLLSIIGSLGGVLLFQSALLPEYQQIVVTQIPFMRAFLPPTPAGGVLPTSAPPENGNISPEDLLAAPLLLVTGTPTMVSTQAPTIQVEPSATATLTATPLPATFTPAPSETPSNDAAIVQPTQAADVQISVPSRPSSARLFAMTHVKQTWNNCGPANITMALSYFGWQDDQTVAASFLKPDKEDKNVNPGEMVAFVNEQSGVKAITRIGGSLDMIKDFIAAEFPVIIETGYMPEGYDWIGHYQTIVGYDDLSRVFYLYDSYLGAGENSAGIAEDYDQLDDNWQDFNRTFIVLYYPDRESEVSHILGNRADLSSAAENALAVAQTEARANPQDPFAWYNIGTSLTKLGRYEEAAAAYDQSRRVGVLPWRITWYQHGPFEAYFNAGRLNDVLALVDANLTNGAQYVEETYYWQGKVMAAQGDTVGAISAFRRALNHNPRYAAAQQELNALA